MPINVMIWNENRHETYPTFYNVDLMRVINNAVHWAYSETAEIEIGCRKCDPLKDIHELVRLAKEKTLASSKIYISQYIF